MPVARRNQEGDRFAAVVVPSCPKKTHYLLLIPVAHFNFQMPNSDSFIDVSCPIQEGGAVVVPSCPKKTHYLLLIPVVRNQEGGRFAAVLVPSCPMVTFLWMPPVVRIQEGGAVVVPSCPKKTQYLLMPVARRN